MIRQAAILCGGLGSRLGPLTTRTPKPLLPVGGTSFLQNLIQEISRYGVDRFVLLAAHHSEQIEDFASTLPRTLGRAITVEVSVEPDRAGTGGALFHARERLDDQFFLFNGDSMLDVPIERLAALLRDPNASGALALRHVPMAGRYGVVQLDNHTITSFGDHAPAEEPALINGGVYVFRRALIDRLASQGSLEQDLLPVVAREGGLRGLPCDGFFLDIGVPEDYERAQTLVPDALRRRALFINGSCLFKPNGDWTPGAYEAVALANRNDYYVFVLGRTQYLLAARAELAERGAWIDDDRPLDGVSPSNQIDDLASLWPLRQEGNVFLTPPLDDGAAESRHTRTVIWHDERLDEALAPLLPSWRNEAAG